MQSYTTTEPAIDVTASSMLAFSWQLAAATQLAEPALTPALVSSPFTGGAG